LENQQGKFRFSNDVLFGWRGFSMNMKIFGQVSAGVAMVCLTTTVCVRMGNRAHAQSTDESGIAQQQVVSGIPIITGQWAGTATILGEPASIVLDIAQGDNAASGSCSVGGLPATPFEVAFNQQQGNLSGTWSVDGKHPRPFSGSLTRQGRLELTLNAGAGKHPNCTIDVNGIMSDNRTEIAGSFKSSDQCKNQGQTGTFQVLSQG
jgi:hypothetical protein